MSGNHPLSLLLGFALLVSLGETAQAESTKRINRTIDTGDVKELKLGISVAELDIEITDGNEVELDITLEAQRRYFGLRSGDVSDVELETRRSGQTLFLGIDEKHLQQHWTLSVPASLALTIELGVGEVRIEGMRNDLDLEMGVGDVRVDIVEDQFRDVHLQTGVGDANIYGMRQHADNERSFVSANAYYAGEGEHTLNIELGVGDVEVRRD